MSRLLKQVYSENIYIEFRFESSLRKYDKKPTKKIKCEAFCKHCINHQKKPECSPIRDSRTILSSHSRLKRYGQNSIERVQQKSVISSCKTIKLSKQKVNESEERPLNLLQRNVYRDLMQGDKKNNPVLQKSQQEYNSSMEQEIFFNQFGESVDEQSQRNQIDQDFDKIQITKKNQTPTQNQKEASSVSKASIKKIQQQIPSQQFQNLDDDVDKKQILKQQAKNESQQINLIHNDNKEQDEIEAEDLKIEQQLILPQAENQNQKQYKEKYVQQVNINDQIKEFIIQRKSIKSLPEIVSIRKSYNQLENISEQQYDETIKSYQNDQTAKIQSISQSNLEQRFINESELEKCLVFQGGRIYVDTSGLNFYISVRVFNKLRRKYSDLEQLTNILIQQRPCLISKRDQIKKQLQEYLNNFI